MKTRNNKKLYILPVILFTLLCSVEENPMANEMRMLLMVFFFSAVFIFLYLPVLFLMERMRLAHRWYDDG